jgi:two-component system response regulator RpfG
MATTDTFTCAEFFELDKSFLDDFVDCVRESIEEIETCVSTLNIQISEEPIHKLFRAMHSLKGNCRMVCLEPFAELLHHLEEIVSVIRSHEAVYTASAGEFIFLASEEIYSLILQLVRNNEASESRRVKLLDLVCKLERSTSTDQDYDFKHAIACLRGDNFETDNKNSEAVTACENITDQALMLQLALKLDNLSIYRHSRGENICQLIALLNDALNQPVEPGQLQAAALMHDIGMAFIPHSIFNKEGTLLREELREIQQHVHTGYQLLKRFNGWDDAALMVLDHHERYDGLGYPNRKAGNSIHMGARMLAIIDTYCSITNERSDRSYKKSVLSAISEINANANAQFDPELVEAFNEVVRQQLIKR